jgi:hypothetical protein
MSSLGTSKVPKWFLASVLAGLSSWPAYKGNGGNDLRRQCGSPAASCTGLQSRQLHANQLRWPFASGDGELPFAQGGQKHDPRPETAGIWRISQATVGKSSRRAPVSASPVRSPIAARLTFNKLLNSIRTLAYRRTKSTRHRRMRDKQSPCCSRLTRRRPRGARRRSGPRADRPRCGRWPQSTRIVQRKRRPTSNV